MIRDYIEEQPANTGMHDLLQERLANDARVVNRESGEYIPTWLNGKVTGWVKAEMYFIISQAIVFWANLYP